MLMFIADFVFVIWTIVILCTVADMLEALIYNIFVN